MVTPEELEQLIDINSNWIGAHNLVKREAANALLLKYTGKKIKLNCGSCIQTLRNWVLSEIANG